MDWFQRLTGFREISYDDTRSKLEVVDRKLKSKVNGQAYAIGNLELVSLQALRERAKHAGGLNGRLHASIAKGDVRRMHSASENVGALFQVASQFNLLEMTSFEVTPENGVTRYQYDRTQGPACAIAAGAATIYRNYFAPVADAYGQTAKRQFDGLSDMGQALSRSLSQPVQAFWKMQNGYALCTPAGLDAIANYLQGLTPEQTDDLRSKLRIGIQSEVEVTDAVIDRRRLVSQAFCSALPVAYTDIPSIQWKPFAILVLEAAYEATMWAAVLNAQRGASNAVLLTMLGAGAFGNSEEWVFAAMRRALHIVSGFKLNVKLVSYGEPSRGMLQIANDFA